MEWKWTDHILLQIKERNISKQLIDDALNDPDNKKPGSGNRLIYQKRVSGKLLRIVTEGDS